MFRFSHSVSSQCHEGNVSALLFKTNELLISGGYDSDIKAYLITDKELKQQVKLLQDTQKEVLKLKSENGYQLVYIDGVNAHKSQVSGIVTTLEESSIIATFSRDGAIKIFDISNWLTGEQGAKQMFVLEAHKSEVLAGAFSMSGKLFLAGSKDNYISMWNLENGQILKFFQAHNSDVNFVTFLNNDQFFMTGCFEGDFKLWKTEGGQIAQVQDNLQSKDDILLGGLGNDVVEDDSKFMESNLLQQPDLQKLLVSQSKNTPVEIPISNLKLHQGEVHTSVIGMRKPVLITGQQTQYLRVWDVSSVTKPRLVKEIFSHIDDIMDIEVVNEKAKIVSIVSKDGLFSVMNCQNATKLFN